MIMIITTILVLFGIGNRSFLFIFYRFNTILLSLMLSLGENGFLYDPIVNILIVLIVFLIVELISINIDKEIQKSKEQSDK